MGIKRYIASADTTITNAFKMDLKTRGTGSNMGAADILDVFSIYAQASGSSTGLSQELSRALLKFPVSDMSTDRAAGTLPKSGSVNFYLRLFNAEHGETLPRNFTLTASAVTQDWEEGTGLDMVEYSDETYEGAGTNWAFASEGTSWNRNGGDFYYDRHWISSEALSNSSFDQTFSKGIEDLEINITSLTEYWLATSAASTATITITGYTELNSGDKVNLVATDGTNYDFTNGDQSSVNGTWESTTSNNQTATNLMNVINTTSGPSGTRFTATVDGAVVTVTQATAGIDGDTTVTLTDGGTAGMSKTDFTGGAGRSNYGIGLHLTGTQEAYNKYSDTGGAVQNLSGSTRSYYTKKFFSRTSEFFFKRPMIEARWDSAKKDDRGNFFYSSSLAPGPDNLNTLFLYNYVRGQLKDIPQISTTGSIMLSLYSGSATDTTPHAEAIQLAVGGGVSTALETYASGGWYSTGIYTASVAVTAAATPVQTLYDVWSTGSIIDGNHLKTRFHTGSIKPDSLESSNINPATRYVLNISNLKNVYSNEEIARFRVYTRLKNWSPTIYTKAVATAENNIIDSASFKVVRLVDSYEVIGWGTGSDLHTQLSFDVSGNYFDLNMSMLEPDFAYGIKLAFYNGAIGDWVEQPHTFKFRVEE